MQSLRFQSSNRPLLRSITLVTGLVFASVAGIFLHGASSSLVSLGMLGAVAFVILIFKPELGLYAMVFLIPFEARNMVGEVTLVRVIGIIMILAWTIRHLLHRTPPSIWLVRNSPMSIFVFVVIVTLSILWADEKSTAMQGIFRIIQLYVFYIVVSDIVDSWYRARLVLAFLLLGAGIAVVMSLIDLNSNASTIGFGGMDSDKFRIGGGISGGLNEFAANTALVLPFAYYLLKHSKWKPIKIGVILYVLLAAIAVIATFSRTGWLLFVVMTVLSIMFLSGGSLLQLGTVVVVLIGSGVTIISYLLPVDVILAATFEDDSVSKYHLSGRLYFWQASLDAFFTNPILGVGYENARTAVFERLRDPFSSEIVLSRPLSVHSMYIKILTELGLMGFSAFIFAVGWTLKSLAKAFRAIESSALNREENRALLIAISISIVGFLIVGLVATIESEKYFWLLLALAFSTRRIAEQSAVSGIKTKSPELFPAARATV